MEKHHKELEAAKRNRLSNGQLLARLGFNAHTPEQQPISRSESAHENKEARFS